MTSMQNQGNGVLEQWDIVLTAGGRAAIRQRVRSTAAMFGVRLSAECVEDLVQDVLLRLWKHRTKRNLHACLAYVRQVAVNATIDSIRRYGAKKRSAWRTLGADILLWQPSRTPEEIVIAREEARKILAKDKVLRKRVQREIRRKHLRRPTSEKRESKRYENRRRTRR
jgi:DNA-directed RNA polymerase specialized sigma24 family protein